MDRSVLLLVAGGCLLVGGLWLTALFASGSNAWLFGALLAGHGLAGLVYGGWRLLQRDGRRSTV